jgi:hypothetical protein
MNTRRTHRSEKPVDIIPLPIQGSRFQPQIWIMREGRTFDRMKNFSTAHYFDREEDAIRYGILHARGIIDGKVNDCSIADLYEMAGEGMHHS